MATDVGPNTEPSVTRLVSGIIDDAQTLIKQQAELLKQELKKDLREAKETGAALAVGGALLGAGSFLLLFMLAELLHWKWPQLERWGAFAIVGGLLTLAGGVFFLRGRQKLDKLSPLPEQTVKGVKENLQWKTNPS